VAGGREGETEGNEYHAGAPTANKRISMNECLGSRARILD
jgi:hypothetical protein